MLLLCLTKWSSELKKKQKQKNFKRHLFHSQWPRFQNNFTDKFLMSFYQNAKLVPLGRTKWPPELKIRKNLQGFLSLLVTMLSLLAHHMVFFPCWCFTWSSFPAGVSQKIHTLKFCHNSQTKWSPLIDISQKS